MLTVENLSVSIQRALVLRDASLHVPPGASIGLVGRNGAGKTTLMRAVMGLLKADEGRILLEGRDLAKEPPHRRARLSVGYLPEDRRLVPNFTVEENILVPLWATRRDENLQRLKWVYDLMPEIARFADRKALSLSGGQQKLVALGRAMIVGERLLLLDEPFEGVAPALAQRLLEVIGELRNEGMSVLLSESDYTHSASIVDRVYAIERGEIKLLRDDIGDAAG